jgi:hypothetical protein
MASAKESAATCSRRLKLSLGFAQLLSTSSFSDHTSPHNIFGLMFVMVACVLLDYDLRIMYWHMQDQRKVPSWARYLSLYCVSTLHHFL